MLPFRFYLITPAAHGRHRPEAVVRELAQAGLRALQVRKKTLPPAELAAYCQTLLQALGEHRAGLRLFLNGEAALAETLGFDGVHLPSDRLTGGAEKPGSTLLRGASTHSLTEVRAAEAAGVDFVTFGPVFHTASKARFGAPLGLEALAEAAKTAAVPVLALGGVTPERCKDCMAAGAAGVAAISAIWDADQPPRSLERFAAALGGL